jgi:ferredoxin
VPRTAARVRPLTKTVIRPPFHEPIVVVAMAVLIDVEACVQCGTCVEECPAAAISLDVVPVVSAEDCVNCGICVDVCPSGAIALA